MCLKLCANYESYQKDFKSFYFSTLMQYTFHVVVMASNMSYQQNIFSEVFSLLNRFRQHLKPIQRAWSQNVSRWVLPDSQISWLASIAFAVVTDPLGIHLKIGLDQPLIHCLLLLFFVFPIYGNEKFILLQLFGPMQIWTPLLFFLMCAPSAIFWLDPLIVCKIWLIGLLYTVFIFKATKFYNQSADLNFTYLLSCINNTCYLLSGCGYWL